MKNKSLITNAFRFWIVTMLIVSFVSCSHKISFLPSSVAPAARGYITVNDDKNKNYVIKVELMYLAEANRMNPPKKTYVVWMESNNNPTQNIGQIITSSKLKVSFETVSSTKPTKVFITAENDPTVQNPTSEVVLATDSF